MAGNNYGKSSILRKVLWCYAETLTLVFYFHFSHASPFGKGFYADFSALVCLEGFEPSTLALKVRCSSRWATNTFGGRSWIRTNTHGISTRCSSIGAILPLRPLAPRSWKMTIGEQRTLPTSSKLFHTSQDKRSLCLWPLTILRFGRHPFCLSLGNFAHRLFSVWCGNSRIRTYSARRQQFYRLLQLSNSGVFP